MATTLKYRERKLLRVNSLKTLREMDDPESIRLTKSAQEIRGVERLGDICRKFSVVKF